MPWVSPADPYHPPGWSWHPDLGLSDLDEFVDDDN